MKLKIYCSPLGMYSLPHDNFQISALNPDGTLNERKLDEFCRSIANNGAAGFRDFPWYWNKTDAEMISPFVYDKTFASFDLTNYNERYFNIQRKFAEYAKKYNLIYIYCLYNWAEYKQKDSRSPWKRNIQGTAFSTGLNVHYLEKYERKCVETFSGLSNVHYEICNEPVDILWIADRLGYMHNYLKVPKSKIMHGIDYAQKEFNEHMGKKYRAFRNKAEGQQGFKRGDVKKVVKSTVHQVEPGHLKNIFFHNIKQGHRPPPNHTRKILWSFDGTFPRADRETVSNCVSLLTKYKPGALLKDNYSLEVIYGKEVDITDPLAALKGAVEQWINDGGEIPENLNKFEKVEDTPGPVEDETPETKDDPGDETDKIVEDKGGKKMVLAILYKYKIEIAITILVLLFILVFSWCGKSPVEGRLKEQNKQLQAQIVTLGAEIEELKKEGTALSAEIHEQAGIIDGYKRKNETLETKLKRKPPPPKTEELKTLELCKREFKKLTLSFQECMELNKSKKTEIDALNLQLFNYDKWVLNLRNREEKLETQVANQRAMVANFDALREELKRKLKKQGRRKAIVSLLIGFAGAFLVKQLLR